MATKKAARKKAAKRPAADSMRCWPGYEAVPGKAAGTQGSCREKPASRSSPKEKAVQEARQREIDQYQKEHPGAPRRAAQGKAPRKRGRKAPR